eukprot:INCI8795.1.p1 GENE.INCI8795.1~~INCI8795.1.p1  ORF type:complete len:371 (+),score=55.53 INCI8795.1:214-1326(+)
MSQSGQGPGNERSSGQKGQTGGRGRGRGGNQNRGRGRGRSNNTSGGAGGNGGGRGRGRPGRNRKAMDPHERLSRALSAILRHKALELKLSMGTDGYVPLREVMALGQFKQYSREDFVKAVETNAKQRYALRVDEDGTEFIRANQGHSIQLVRSEDAMERIQSADQLPSCVHGTDPKSWKKILRSGGLNRMRRNHIHMAIGLPGDSGVVSGMRNGANVYVFVDAAKMLAAGIPLYRSANNVILCEGDKCGFVSLEFFSKVRTADGKVLFDPATPEGAQLVAHANQRRAIQATYKRAPVAADESQPPQKKVDHDTEPIPPVVKDSDEVDETATKALEDKLLPKFRAALQRCPRQLEESLDKLLRSSSSSSSR